MVLLVCLVVGLLVVVVLLLANAAGSLQLLLLLIWAPSQLVLVCAVQALIFIQGGDGGSGCSIGRGRRHLIG